MRKYLQLAISAVLLLAGTGTCAIQSARDADEHYYETIAETAYEARTEPSAETTVSAGPETGAEAVPEEETPGTEASPEPVPQGIADFLQTTSGCVGWISLPGTKIDYPVMQSGDDEYYLSHNVSGEKNYSGSIFLEAAHQIDGPGLHTIYGHNMKNGSMFHGIVKYKDSGYFAEHRQGILYTARGPIPLEAFAVYAGSADTAYMRNVAGQQLQEFIEQKTGSPHPEISSVYALITCSYGAADERTYLLLSPRE